MGQKTKSMYKKKLKASNGYWAFEKTDIVLNKWTPEKMKNICENHSNRLLLKPGPAPGPEPWKTWSLKNLE